MTKLIHLDKVKERGLAKCQFPLENKKQRSNSLANIQTIKNKIKESKSGNNSTFRLEEDEAKKIRILTNIDDVPEVERWDRFAQGEKPVTIISPEVVGEKDPFKESPESYDLKGFKLITYFPFQVWDYADEKIRIWMLKATNKSPLVSLVAFIEESDMALTDCDFTIKRNGTGYDTTYTVTPRKASKFAPTKDGKAKVVKAVSHKKLIEKMFTENPTPDLSQFSTGRADEEIDVGGDDEDGF